MSTASSGPPHGLGPGEPPEGEDAPEQPSRTARKRERVNNEQALARLAKDLLGLNEEQWTGLQLPEDTLDALRDAKKIRSHTAKERQMRLVRSTLRDADWMSLRRECSVLQAGELGRHRAPSDPRVNEWVEQLLIQGDAALARFIEEFPDADRKRLRQLVRNVRSLPAAKSFKAREQLERAVQLILE